MKLSTRTYYIPTQEQFDENLANAKKLFANSCLHTANLMQYGIMRSGSAWFCTKASWLWYYFLSSITRDDLKDLKRQQQYWNVIAKMNELGNENLVWNQTNIKQ